MKKRALISVRTVLGLAMLAGLAGCVVHEVDGPGPVVVDQGYYYDGDYYDNVGIYHPRVVYYYDGHGWDHRGYAPAGVIIHDRNAYAHARGGPVIHDYGRPGGRR